MTIRNALWTMRLLYFLKFFLNVMSFTKITFYDNFIHPFNVGNILYPSGLREPYSHYVSCWAYF